MEKDALLERLVRLGATDVPGTPRLLMRKRSPEELAGLQHGVENAFGKLQGPATAAVGRAADKTFTPRIAGALKGIASMGIKNPEIIPMQAVPVPGLTPAYLAGKRGLEKLIDKVSPIAKHAMDPALVGALKQTAGAGAKLRLKSGIGQFAGKTFNAQAARLHPALEVMPDPFKAAFATSQYSYPLNPIIESQASHQPGFLAPNLQSVTQKKKQAAGAPTRGNFYMSSDLPSVNPPDLSRVIQKRSGASGMDEPNQGVDKVGDLDYAFDPAPKSKKAGFKLEGDAVIEVDKKGKSLGKGNILEKDSDMLPDFVTYSQGDFKKSKYSMPLEEMAKFVAELRKHAGGGNSIMGVSPTLGGAPQAAASVGAPKLSGPGPSIAQQTKPKGPHFGSGIAGAFKGSIGGRGPQDLS